MTAVVDPRAALGEMAEYDDTTHDATAAAVDAGGAGDAQPDGHDSSWAGEAGASSGGGGGAYGDDAWSGEEMLLRAARDGDALRVARLVEDDGVDVNCFDDVGNTPLHAACAFGRVVCAKRLLALGADVAARSHAGSTPLHAAATNGNLRTVEDLVLAGAPVVARTVEGITARDMAERLGLHEVVAYLKLAARSARMVNVRSREAQQLVDEAHAREADARGKLNAASGTLRAVVASGHPDPSIRHGAARALVHEASVDVCRDGSADAIIDHMLATTCPLVPEPPRLAASEGERWLPSRYEWRTRDATPEEWQDLDQNAYFQLVGRRAGGAEARREEQLGRVMPAYVSPSTIAYQIMCFAGGDNRLRLMKGMTPFHLRGESSRARGDYTRLARLFEKDYEVPRMLQRVAYPQHPNIVNVLHVFRGASMILKPFVPSVLAQMGRLRHESAVAAVTTYAVFEWLPHTVGSVVADAAARDSDPPFGIDVPRMVFWLLQACYALAHMQLKGGVAHCHIRPNNVYVEPDTDRVVIGDFQHSVTCRTGDNQPRPFVDPYDLGARDGRDPWKPVEVLMALKYGPEGPPDVDDEVRVDVAVEKRKVKQARLAEQLSSADAASTFATTVTATHSSSPEGDTSDADSHGGGRLRGGGSSIREASTPVRGHSRSAGRPPRAQRHSASPGTADREGGYSSGAAGTATARTAQLHSALAGPTGYASESGRSVKFSDVEYVSDAGERVVRTLDGSAGEGGDVAADDSSMLSQLDSLGRGSGDGGSTTGAATMSVGSLFSIGSLRSSARAESASRMRSMTQMWFRRSAMLAQAHRVEADPRAMARRLRVNPGVAASLDDSDGADRYIAKQEARALKSRVVEKSKWEKELTEDGYQFFYNVETGMSMWHRPLEYKSDSDSEDESVIAATSMGLTDSVASMRSAGGRTVAGAAGSGDSGAQPLPAITEGWEFGDGDSDVLTTVTADNVDSVLATPQRPLRSVESKGLPETPPPSSFRSELAQQSGVTIEHLLSKWDVFSLGRTFFTVLRPRVKPPIYSRDKRTKDAEFPDTIAEYSTRVIPVLPECYPLAFQGVLRGMVRADPNRRMSAVDAADILEVVLFGPHEEDTLFRGRSKVDEHAMAEWLRRERASAAFKVHQLESMTYEGPDERDTLENDTPRRQWLLANRHRYLMRATVPHLLRAFKMTRDAELEAEYAHRRASEAEAELLRLASRSSVSAGLESSQSARS